MRKYKTQELRPKGCQKKPQEKEPKDKIGDPNIFSQIGGTIMQGIKNANSTMKMP